ncbi:Fic family protein [Lentibacillus sediminis]|uniref:Fic family protein n=1 Tax=Lentibacillus sediminis TaxID=1940529 RepID=UPI0013046D60|nr:Fic family protein [Lentibacillus sediminis]
MIDKIDNNAVSAVKDIHENLTDRLQHDKGKFKTEENFIKGTEFSTAPPELVPQLMDQLIGNLNYRLENSHSDDGKLCAILEAYIQFEKIHPFSDGNGRTGRMVMNYSLLENNLPPIIIKKEDKNTYIHILVKHK